MIKLKRIQYALLPLILLSFFLVPSIPKAHAVDPFEVTKVRGQVFGPGNQPLVLADVSVTCSGQTKTTKTGANGKYIVVFFGQNVCKAGDIATIIVTKGGLSGQ